MRERSLFVLAVLALMIPYFAFLMYVSVHYPSGAWPNPWPLWLRYTLPGWLIANWILTEVLRKRMLKVEVAEPEKTRLARSVSLRISVSLGIFWCLLFVGVVLEGVRGKLALDRAIPPGIFLLLFTGFLGWGIYRAERGRDDGLNR
jgi:hypothetical protein